MNSPFVKMFMYREILLKKHQKLLRNFILISFSKPFFPPAHPAHLSENSFPTTKRETILALKIKEIKKIVNGISDYNFNSQKKAYMMDYFRLWW